MASITVNTNFKEVMGGIAGKLDKLKDTNYLLRPVATEVIPLMTERIHQDGKASDGTEIGTYSNSYLRQRVRNKRGTSTKVIVSLTRQLENDWSVIETPKGYGIGFTNSFNADKLRFVEEIKGKRIGDLSKGEIDYATERINELVADVINE